MIPDTQLKRISLTRNQYAIVDSDVFEILNKVNWYAFLNNGNKQFYARRSICGVNKRSRQLNDFLHWNIIGYPLNGKVVDHINGDTLDNRRCNLRIISRRQNCLNKKSHRSGKISGASYAKWAKKWRSKILVNGKYISLGYFDSQKEAHEKYLSFIDAGCL